MKKKLLFVFNPFSGKGQIKNRLLSIVDYFVKSGYEVTVYPTQQPQDAVELIELEAGRYELIVCSGGDGTLDEVVSGMMRRKERVPIGYIPSGSTNDFAGSLKIPKNMDKAARVAVEGTPFACDVGSFNGEYFVYIAAFGLFTDVSYATSQDLKNRIGHLAYLLEGVKRITSIQSFHLQISVNGREIEDEFIYGMITNSTSAGGFKNITGKNVKLDDGMFEVTLIRMPKNPIELNAIIASLTNLIDDTDLIYTFKTDALNIRSLEKISWTLDGEYGGDHIEVEIYNEKQAVEIMVKPGMKFLPENTFLFGRNKL
ncbi:MAG: diacylglycerol kinase family lipid kinase [Lachnospiraceae bacterium]|jgi:YegS/Rv2252/BmrU family lipid kinase|nr:diacylglycerol kinase family lipid kinase [Lachnospiraceae bacterium]